MDLSLSRRSTHPEGDGVEHLDGWEDGMVEEKKKKRKKESELLYVPLSRTMV